MYTIAMLIPPTAMATAVYQCTVDSVATFSQLPCGKDAKEIKIPLTNVTQTANTQQSKDIMESVDNYITIQKVDREIALYQREIKQLQNTLAEQKTKINYMTQDSANKMGANSIADAIAQRTAHAEQRIESKIKQYQQQIDALNAFKAQLSQ
ncbi:RNA-binding protein [Pseudoalteromonas ostreae]|uniref:RNA-binding protein n=1 Tax=Pseudoalteromonas ostreae TaxID=2774154 RepID=UPI0023AB3123|nr:RNA-binding protein [Pseudoalteromonas ostreae]